MNQGNVIAGSLIFAFVFYIAAKGELPKYMGFLFGPSKGSPPFTPSPATNSAGNASVGLGTILRTIDTLTSIW